MGGSQTTTSRQDSYQDQVSDTRATGIDAYQRQFGQDYSSLMNMFYGRANTPLELERAPIFSQGLDPIVQGQLSRGISDIKAKQSAEQRGTAQALNIAGSGENSALLNALNRQSAIGQAGAINQLYPSALEQQRGFDLQRQAMIQARNQETLAARNQLMGELAQGGNLLQLLNQMTQIARGQATRTTGTATQEGGSRTSKSYF